MNGRLTGFSLNRDGSQNITLTVTGDFSADYDELKDQAVEVTIRKARKRRSMDANAYCWKLIDLISEKTGIKKREVYRGAIREIGGVSDQVICRVDAAETFIRNWERQGTGYQAEVLDVDVTGWATVTVYYGSSTYDSRQMARLIDSLIQDAEALGIPTITEEEAARMTGRKRAT